MIVQNQTTVAAAAAAAAAQDAELDDDFRRNDDGAKSQAASPPEAVGFAQGTAAQHGRKNETGSPARHERLDLSAATTQCMNDEV